MECNKNYREVKTVNLRNGWSIDCITRYNANTGQKSYYISVCMETVIWREEVEKHGAYSTPAEANAKFLELKEKYLKKPIY